MNISKALFQKIFDAAKERAFSCPDYSNSHALSEIIDIVGEYRDRYPEIDEETENLIVQRYFNPPHEAFPK